jgi:hypothetical protein
LILRPAIDAINQEEVSFVVAVPGIAAGTALVEARSEMFGGEINTGWQFKGPSAAGKAFIGFRAIHLDEGLSVTDTFRPLQTNVLTFLGQPANPPAVLQDVGTFDTSNTFFGPQLGGRLCWHHGCWQLEAFAKLGIGVTHEELDIRGTTTLVTPGGVRVAEGSILALTSNIGNYDSYVFGIVPEGGINVGANLSNHIRFRAGYSFLFWNSVIRPGDQIDRAVNPGLVPTDQEFGAVAGPARPAPLFRDRSFWVHTLNLGLEVHY